MVKDISIEKVVDIFKRYFMYIGAYEELSQRDIEYDWNECVDELESLSKELKIENEFDFKSIRNMIENQDINAHEEIYKIENEICALLNSLLFGYIYR